MLDMQVVGTTVACRPAALGKAAALAAAAASVVAAPLIPFMPSPCACPLVAVPLVRGGDGEACILQGGGSGVLCRSTVVLGNPNIASVSLVLLVKLRTESVLEGLTQIHFMRPRIVNLATVSRVLEVLASATHFSPGQMMRRSRWWEHPSVARGLLWTGQRLRRPRRMILGDLVDEFGFARP
jgi:hypothetical protein